EEQLEQAQRLESVGLLVGGIAHDFNNLLTAIQGYASLLIRSLDGDTRQTMAIDLKKVGEQAAGLTRQLLGASRRHPRDPKPLDLSALVSETAGLLRRLLGETVELEIDLAKEAIGVCADAAQIQQILLNLAVNSRDAMAGQSTGRLLLATRRVLEGDAWWSELIVEDTGCGMDEDVAARIFEPFYTTKDVDHGTGLGLSTVRGILLRHEGRIDVRSRPGEGTRFRILLPSVRLLRDDAITTGEHEDARGRGETVLVVEDEDVVRILASDFLRHLGYQVIEAKDGVEAESVFEDCGHGIDIVLSDVVMPRLGGPELARRMAPRWPTVCWVFMSGYPGRERLPKLPQGEAPFLEKPFKPTLLGDCIRSVLDAR
ncbi:MAG: ATP-binding protein, partial [Acidobacteriota bacterium]